VIPRTKPLVEKLLDDNNNREEALIKDRPPGTIINQDISLVNLELDEIS
jgi:hypothetical protein